MAIFGALGTGWRASSTSMTMTAKRDALDRRREKMMAIGTAALAVSLKCLRELKGLYVPTSGSSLVRI